jgi:hypothetical protein
MDLNASVFRLRSAIDGDHKQTRRVDTTHHSTEFSFVTFAANANSINHDVGRTHQPKHCETNNCGGPTRHAAKRPSRGEGCVCQYCLVASGILRYDSVVVSLAGFEVGQIYAVAVHLGLVQGRG